MDIFTHQYFVGKLVGLNSDLLQHMQTYMKTQYKQFLTVFKPITVFFCIEVL